MKENMGVMQLFSEEVRKFWNGWEVRSMVLLSLLLQIVLIVFGSRRKSTRGISVRCVVWLAYLSADWVATVSLGNLATSEGNSKNDSSKQSNRLLQSFWAPFLLLHLGGPDTITAYSLEDNELWIRHLLGLVIEIGVAFYVFIWSWSKTPLTFISIPIFISGCIKYGERTYVLWSASTKQFKEALISNNSFAENAMRFAMGKNEEYYFERYLSTEESTKKLREQDSSQNQDVCHMYEAHFLFKRLKYLFANLVLGLNERMDCYSIIDRKSAKAAFELVAIELGYLYDLLYTKAAINYTRLGILLHTITFFSSVLVLVFFSFLVNMEFYSPTDICITFLLLVVAVLLEVYAFILLLSSDWTELWLEKLQIRQIHSILASMRRLIQLVLPTQNMKRWSVSAAQYNLLSYCLKETNGMFIGVWKLSYISKWLEEYQYLTWVDVDGDIQKLIFNQLKEKGKKIKDTYTIKSCKELLAQRGDYVLKKEGIGNELNWSIDLEFDHSLLVWHIATDVCYYDDFSRRGENKSLPECKVSKCLSNYMLYLLVLCPSMLPRGIGEIRYRDTCAHLMQCCSEKDDCESEKKQKKDVYEMLFKKISRRPINQSVLSDGCKLARDLKSLGSEVGLENKWKIISGVWIEILAYVANQCGWKEHAQQLRRGGELLTHVSVLMAHLGLNEQYNEMERLYII